MLLSPLQSPSPPPSNGSLLEGVQHPKTTNNANDDLQGVSPQPYAVSMQKPLQPTPEHSPDHLPTLTRGQKRTRSEIEDCEEKVLDQTGQNKRQRTGLAIAQQEQELTPTVESTQGVGKFMSKAGRVEAKEKSKRNKLVAPLAQRRLPWKLRPRNAKSYRETGAGMITGYRDRRRSEARGKSRLAERIT